MPVPVSGLGQHYDVDANEYFEHHQIDDRGLSASNYCEQPALQDGRLSVSNRPKPLRSLRRIAQAQKFFPDH